MGHYSLPGVLIAVAHFTLTKPSEVHFVAVNRQLAANWSSALSATYLLRLNKYSLINQ